MPDSKSRYLAAKIIRLVGFVAHLFILSCFDLLPAAASLGLLIEFLHLCPLSLLR